jgi:hypothetical protein
MNDDFKLGTKYRRGRMPACDWQLAFKAQGHWYVTKERLNDVSDLGGALAGASDIAWSSDGCALYGTNYRRQFVRLLFGKGHLPVGEEDITPIEWQATGSRALKVWPVKGSSNIFCLVSATGPNFQDGPHTMSLWHFSEHPRRWKEVVLGLPIGLSTDIAAGVFETVLAVADQAHPGLLHLFDFPNSYSRKLQVSDSAVLFPALSPDGLSCAYATRSAGNNQAVFVCDLATGQKSFVSEGICATWSPDGKALAVLGVDERLMIAHVGYREVHEVLIATTPEGGQRQPGIGVSIPQWSPNGDLVVFALLRWARPKPSVSDWISTATGARCADDMFGIQTDFVLHIPSGAVVNFGMRSTRWAWRPTKN